jgi:hypothetical protein
MRLIRVNVVDRRHESDDPTVLDGDRQVVAWVREKLVGPRGIDRVV